MCSRSYERYFTNKVHSATYEVELEVVEVMISEGSGGEGGDKRKSYMNFYRPLIESEYSPSPPVSELNVRTK